MTQSKKKTNLPLIIALSVSLALGTTLYALADRYLIDHVEVQASTAQVTTQSPLQTSGNLIATNQTNLQTTTSGETENTPALLTANSYQSDNVSIKISQVVTGNGEDTVTYYVADVLVSDIAYLQSAFANGTFGRNIVDVTSNIATENNAVFAINGDYFGFRSNGIEIRNGILYRDEPARIGAAISADGSMFFYDETAITSEQLLADGIVQTLSFGPILVEDGVAVTDFGQVKIDSNMGNRASIAHANPRTGIGMIEPNHYVFIVVDGRSSGYSRGVTLVEFAQLFADLGCVNAYNLDGGGSSTMYFNGQVVNNPLGRNSEREVSDIMYIGA
ncbi:MAG: phosphodiester glycosidase family protein [Eubacteriales bacterium]|nr:phosphodiester glycosidase family protein [Eubacteriales bacterium]